MLKPIVSLLLTMDSLIFAQAALSFETITVALTSKAFQYTVLPIAQDRGYFKEEGIDLKITYMQNAAGLQALIANTVNFSGSGSSALVEPSTAGDRAAVAQEIEISGVRFEMEKTIYRPNESINALFVNGSKNTVFIVMPNSCGLNPIQKLADKGWTYISFPKPGFACLQMIFYRPVGAGATQQLTYSPDDIREMTRNNTRGTYRFLWPVASKAQGDSKPVISPEFQIREEES